MKSQPLLKEYWEKYNDTGFTIMEKKFCPDCHSMWENKENECGDCGEGLKDVQVKVLAWKNK